MILDDIVEAKRREVAERKETTPLSALEAAIEGMPPTRDFRRALGGGDCAIIAEVKRRSPSRGLHPGGFRSRPDRRGNMKGTGRRPSPSSPTRPSSGGATRI